MKTPFTLTAIAAVFGLLSASVHAATAFMRTGLDGAGFQNVIAVDPFDINNNTILLGGDTAGISRSVDRGAVFDPANKDGSGGDVFFGRKNSVAAFAFAPLSGLVYAAAGSNYSGGVLSGGGFYRSLDSGATWEFRSDVPQLWGKNKSNELTGAPAEHPRPTGKLIAINSVNNMFIGTFRDGVMRSYLSDGGATWLNLGTGSSSMAGKYIRALCQPSHLSEYLLVGTYGDGAWLSTNADTTAANVTFVKQTGAPDVVEEFVALGSDSRIYAVCGSAGVYRVQISAGSTVWTRIGGSTIKDITNTPADPPRWAAIDGFVSGPDVTLYVGADNPYVDANGQAQSIMKATSSTTTFSFSSVTPGAPDPLSNSGPGVHYTLATTTGATTTPWWLAQTGETYMLNKGTFVAAQIAINPNNTDHVYVAGRSGAWRSLNGGSDWHPIVSGLQATFNRAVVIDPNIAEAQRVYIASTDWTLLGSTDGLGSVQQRRPSSADSVGTSIALDSTTGSGNPSRVHVATCDRDLNRDGEVFYSDDPMLASPTWNSHGLETALIAAGIYGEKIDNGSVVTDTTTGRRVLAVAFRNVGSANTLVAAVDGGGVWRKTWATDPATGTWSQVSAVAMATVRDQKQTAFLWPLDAALFLHDRKTGLWRSMDQGATWTNVWNDTSIRDGGDATGFLSAQIYNTTQVRLFLSMKAKLWRVNAAEAGDSGTWNIVQVGASTLVNPGPTSFADSALWITDSSNPPKFYKGTQLSTATPVVTQEDAASGGVNYYAISPAAETPAGLVSSAVTGGVKHYVVGNGAIQSPAAPSISSQPLSQTVLVGSAVTFSVSAGGTVPFTYQWRKNGAAISGATNATLNLSGVQSADAGNYFVTVTNSSGSITSNAATLSVNVPPDPGRIINLSILTTITVSDPLFTVGTVIGGSGTSGSKPLLIRAVGPSLTQLGVGGALIDPKLDVFFGQTVVATNDNWGGGSALGAAFAQVGAFPFTGATSMDAAVFNPTLASGGYTVQVSGVEGATGTVIAELYDATPNGTFTATTPRLVNVSVLKQISAGEILTAGFVIGGSTAKQVLIRAIGPGLAQFGVGGTMADPKLDLFSGQTVINSNNDWGGGSALATAFTSVGAFALPAASKDAALLVTLAPGSYTAQASGVEGTGGVALVEVYEVP